ncbi:MAG: aromatic ring-hydroxylating dioxygenase subunit alpha [Chloroflexia bacterium]|nr:aromatic ring-hydroxylating dioxygenase subunit alpha [Chloroflexia bacterium]
MVAVAPRFEDLRAALAAGQTLPAGWYTDPAIFRREQAAIFRRSWQYAGHAARLAAAGDYFTVDLGAVPVVVLSDRAGTLRAFVNVCRHRGHQVAHGHGNARALQCPYHAWTYGLDGSLRAAPRADREPGFDPCGYALFPLPVETWGPLIFVNLDPDARPLSVALGDLPAAIAAMGRDLAGLTMRHRQEYHLAANWKVFVENSIECYHCPVAHPGFSELIDVAPDSMQLIAGPGYVQHRGWLRANEERTGPPDFLFSYVFPGTMLSMPPGRLNLTLVHPIDSEQTLVVTEYYFAGEVSEEQVAEQVAFTNRTKGEDQALVESVQRGLRSGMLPQGRFLSNSEHLLQHVDRMVVDALEGDPV